MSCPARALPSPTVSCTPGCWEGPCSLPVPQLRSLFCFHSPHPHLGSSCCAWNPPDWVRVLSSWTRSRSALSLSCQPPARCLWEWVLPEQSQPSCALGWGPGACLGCCKSCRPPLFFVPQCSAQCPLFLSSTQLQKSLLAGRRAVTSPTA